MNQPHVEALHYRLMPAGGIWLAAYPPLVHATGAFRLQLQGVALIVEMLAHHPTAEAARAVVVPFLEAWSVYVGLQGSVPRFSFEFERARIIDLASDPPIYQEIVADHGRPAFPVGGVGQPTETIHLFPPPPQVPFEVTEDVAMPYRWYADYIEGREPRLSVMGYRCLSWLQSRAGNRRALASRLGVDEAVLDKLGALTSDVGDEQTARKFDQKSQHRDHTPAEREWVLAALRTLIRRAGEAAADPTARNAIITMADLPSLP